METAGLRFVTGRRSLDIALFLALALTIVTTGWRLGVYHDVVYVEVEWVEIHVDGSRHALETPPPLRRLGRHDDPVRAALGQVEGDIATYMAINGLTKGGPDGESYEWTISWASNDNQPTDSHTIVFGRP